LTRPGEGDFICTRTGQCYVQRARLPSRVRGERGNEKYKNAKANLLATTCMARKGEVMLAERC